MLLFNLASCSQKPVNTCPRGSRITKSKKRREGRDGNLRSHTQKSPTWKKRRLVWTQKCNSRLSLQREEHTRSEEQVVHTNLPTPPPVSFLSGFQYIFLSYFLLFWLWFVWWMYVIIFCGFYILRFLFASGIIGFQDHLLHRSIFVGLFLIVF